MSQDKPAFWYVFCDHWTQGGIGYSFPMGWHKGKRYERTFSTVYTIEKMLDAADEWPGLVSTLEIDAFAYEEIGKEAPETLARLKSALVAGKAGIEGGTYGQPLGQDFGAESNLRQLTYGRSSILNTLDYPVHTFLVEEQWFHPQLPQLLTAAGYRYACLQAQNSGQVMPMHKDVIAWRGADGTTIPTIPSNDLQVSCVRQYTDYAAYRERLSAHTDPLLFQWVEVWVPGMDWGASAEPFRKALADVRAAGGRPTTLQNYFASILPARVLEIVDIPLDNSNYANNWYQAGGWGYDGDRVIQLDSVAEHTLLALETLAATLSPSEPINGVAGSLDTLWRRLMVLQNHDFSCARNYGVWTEDGQLTENGYLAQAGYRKLIADANGSIVRLGDGAPADAWFNATDGAGRRVLTDPDDADAYVEVELPPLGWTAMSSAKRETRQDTKPGAASIGDDRFTIDWRPGSWDVEITDRQQGVNVVFAGVSGRIAKVNEHDGQMWPALSPGHETFSFAFDGTVHAPDQVAAGRVVAEVERVSDVRSTLKLSCDLLTLHTTDTPVARAEIRVHLDHGTGTVSVETFLYSGVWMGLDNCRAIFRHDIADARLFRDYPFGEAEARIEAVYPLSYTRIAGQGPSGLTGLQISHAGSRRAFYHREADGGRVEYLLARAKIRGEYRFRFTLHFGPCEASEAARRARFVTAPFTPIAQGLARQRLPEGRSVAAYDDSRIVITSVSSTLNTMQGMSLAMTQDQGGETAGFVGEAPVLLVRAVNLSDTIVAARLSTEARTFSRRIIAPTGRVLRVCTEDELIVFEPYAIVTLALALEETP